MAFNNRFTLVLFIALAFMSIDIGLATRNLLQATGPPSIPNLPKPNMPSIPSLPQPNFPTLPTGLTLPPLQTLPIGPTIPKLSFPPLPSVTSLPNMPTIPIPTTIPTTMPSIPFLAPPPSST
ncbi:protein app1-like [Humulus lupulus]|uniref:protein app1-like n=1 Tax=Humulus lupulus TaxID=3486 RepID=UPI002B41115B|nr:protein app1-like [Humulus lupulus]